MSELQSMEKPFSKNGFGPNWLGCLVDRLGGNHEDVWCRGSWTNLLRKDDNTLTFLTETAWSRCNEVEDFLCEVFKSDLSIWFIEEELGCDIFQTNDWDHTVFPEYILIDDCDANMIEYFTEDDAVDYLKNKFDIAADKQMRLDDFDDMVDKFNAAHNDGIYIHIAECCND